MTKREMFERNQQLSTSVDLYLLDHPDIADQIPDGALIVFPPEFDKELGRRNHALARRSRAPDQSVAYVEIDRMVASRLQGPTLTLARVRSGERCHRPG